MKCSTECSEVHGEAGGGGVAIPLCTCETLCGRSSGMSFIWVAIKRGACKAE